MTKLQSDRPGSKSNLLSLKLPRRGEAGRLSGRSLSSKRLLSSQIAGAQRRSQGCFAGQSIASGMGIRNVPLPRFGDVRSIIEGDCLEFHQCYSDSLMQPFQPMPLLKRRLPFNDPDFIFEVKWDGFRALAVIEHGRTQLISRNGHRFASFADLEKLISAGLPDTTAVIDGEICSLDKRGRPQFRDLLFHRGNYPCFLAFDLLMRDGKDLPP
jgi:ATP dependent DNA ligase domain